MKKIFLIAISAVLVSGSPLASAQLSPTDHLALNSGMKLWLGAWASKEVATKLEPLYRPDVVTRLNSAPQSAIRTWAEFLKLLGQNAIAPRDAQSADVPNIVSEGERAITTLPSGVRLVWVKTNGVWKIIEQSLPTPGAAVTVSAD